VGAATIANLQASLANHSPVTGMTQIFHLRNLRNLRNL
jgi:hypothetical protein